MDIEMVKIKENMFFDPETDCIIIYANNDRTFIEICGEDRKAIADRVYEMVNETEANKEAMIFNRTIL